MEWCFGFKLHSLINHNGEILAKKITAGNEDERTPVIDLLLNPRLLMRL